MPKVIELKNQAVKEIQDMVKEIKNSDEDDLGAIGSMFDDVSERADSIAMRLHNADQALSSEDDNGNEEPEPEPEKEEDTPNEK